MVSQHTLRRKLQKKAKKKPYRKCQKCGGRMICELRNKPVLTASGKNEWVRGKLTVWLDSWRLFKVCSELKCRHREELFWSDGGIGRHLAHSES